MRGRIWTLFLRKVGASRRDALARTPVDERNCAAESGADGAARHPYQEQCSDAPEMR
jgi:hypothetical protein